MVGDPKPEMTRAERIFVRISVVQTVLAVTGFLIAVIALFAALTEADAVRKQQLASVLPDLVFAQSYQRDEDSARFSFIAVNNGIGPARVKSMQISVDGEAKLDWYSMLVALGMESPGGFGQSQIAGRLVRSGEVIEVLQTTDREVVDAIIDGRSRINFELCFCSVFDECWLPSDSVTEGPTPVDACPEFGDEQFQQ